MYKCEILADSLSPQGDRLTTFKVTYPRIIHAEMCRHRMMSRNTASSRAIPFEKMVKDVQEDPFIPIAWQKNHKGMQGTEYFTEECMIGNENKPVKISKRRNLHYSAANQFRPLLQSWHTSRVNAIKTATELYKMGVTKQLCNRLLEPFVWTTELITTSEEGLMNFFELRCPQYNIGDGSLHKSKKDAIKYIQSKGIDTEIGELFILKELDWIKSSESQAEIHIQALAEAMWDAMNESIPKQLKAGEWHIPFGDRFDNDEGKFVKYLESIWKNKQAPTNGNIKERIKIATARCARISYQTLGDNPKIDYEADIKLHDRLLLDKHFSPFEHCARAMSNEEYRTFIRGKCEVNPISEEVISPVLNEGWCNNYKGFIQHRYLIENEKIN